MTEPSVLLFMDNSNIYISGKKLADSKDGPASRSNFRIDFQNLIKLALAGRNVLRVFVTGSIPPEERAVWDRLEESTGVKPELFERGSVSGGEQGIDQCLQVHMLRAISDFPEPQVAILMTGDGAGYQDGIGFHADLKRMHASGWGIEVLSWNFSCNKALKQWATDIGTFIALDDYYSSITFIKQGRHVAALDLAARPTSNVRLSPIQEASRKSQEEQARKLMSIQKELESLREAQATKQRRKDRHDRRFQSKKK